MRKTIIAAMFLFLAIPVTAGGGRIRIDLPNGNTVPFTKTAKIRVEAHLTKPDNADQISIDEKIEFKIRGQRPGDVCVPISDKSNDQGIVYADCYSAQAGILAIYVYSHTYNDENQYSTDLIFTEPVAPTNKPFETIIPNKKEIISPTVIKIASVSPTQKVTPPNQKQMPTESVSLFEQIKRFFTAFFQSKN